MMIRSAFIAALSCACVASAGEFAGKPYTGDDVYADTWVATDGAGRIVPGFDQAGAVKPDKWVGIFYWTWHRPCPDGPNDNTKLIGDTPPGTPIDWPQNGAPYHWGEPELGYYQMTDPFVIRKHASMLADAGVDAVLFDTTNPPHTWKDQYEALCREYAAMRQEGARTPWIGFIAPFGDPMAVVDPLWRDLYQPGLWKDLWFVWKGKPLLLANREFAKDPAMLDFFTWRRPMPDYWIGPSGPDQWSWLEVYPQHVFRNSAGESEQMSVGVAQNALPNTPGPAPMSHKTGAMGRSWHNGARDMRDGAVNLGLNFDEQWGRAIEVSPQFIFVTGWNEWVAGRYAEWSKYKESECYYPGGLFVDQYTHEYSRDCEPMRGGHSDNYYYQLASWVRRFKGVRPLPLANGAHAIAVDGSFDDWAGVTPEFRDTIGDVTHRDQVGYGGIVYTNDTGRNDIVLSKAAFDDGNLYFFVQTLKPITPYTDANWMLLLIDADQNAATGWLGYDYVVNQEITGGDTTTVKAWRNGAWETVGAGRYRVNGNGMEIAVPRELVGETEGSPSFDFHWADNIQSFGDVSEFGVNGDSAPNRRWNYRFGDGGRLLLDDAPGICTVNRDLYQPHPEVGAAYGVQVFYTGPGIERAEVHSIERVSDEPEQPRVRWSADNGRTWSEFEPLPDMVLREGEYKIYWGPGPRLYDADAGVVVSIWLRQPYKDRTYINHCFSRFSRDFGRTWSEPKLLRYEDGPQFDPANALDTEFLKYNRGYFGTNVIRHSNGTLIHCLTSVNVPYENTDGKSYHRWVAADAKDIGSLCMMGKWNATANDYEWTAGKPVWVPLSVSSRGLMEPFATELKDGRVLVVWRGSDTPETPGRKWFSISADAGETLSPVAEWMYADGTRFYSPSSIHQFIRHSVSGKLYWLGNICQEPPRANHPRHPLVIGEVDEYRAAIKPETVTIIDDRQPGEGPEVQLSNFSLLEDRETHDFELYLTKFGADASNVFTADCYKYEVKIK